MKQKRNKPIKVRGFSLVELMAAAAIMGILVSLALPRYRLFVARGRMAEAKANLGIIATLQQSYFAEYQEYGKIDNPVAGVGGGGGVSGGDAEECNITCTGGGVGKGMCNRLGFRVTDCKRLRYLYLAADTGDGNANANEKVHTALKEIYPKCENTATKYDHWKITEKRKLSHEKNIIELCHE